jgi:hypothetical protein
MKNINKYKLNFSTTYKHKYYNKRKEIWFKYYGYNQIEYGYLRRPRTSSEKRDYFKYCDIIKIRKKRNYKNLPDMYDDIRNSSYCDTSWKDQTKRKHQYKNEKDYNWIRGNSYKFKKKASLVQRLV